MAQKIWWPALIALRIFLFVVFLIASVTTLVLTTKAALATNLKEISIVSGDMLTLGDLFEDVKHNADYVLGPAPAPGQDMVLNARTLYRIATAMDLDWRPHSSAQQLVVRRAATIVPKDNLRLQLKNALAEKGLNGDYKFKFSGILRDIVLPPSAPAEAEIAALSFDPQRDIFEATFSAPSKDKPLKQYAVAGQIERMVRVPVLRETLKHGEVIGINDLDYVDMPQKSVQPDLVIDADDLTGLTPRRMIMAGKPVLANDLMRPQLVERGDQITIYFKQGALVLSAKGKALQSGAQGDLVRVNNTNSNKTLTAQVSGSREVIVR